MMILEKSRHVKELKCDYPWIIARTEYSQGCSSPSLVFIQDEDAYIQHERTIYILYGIADDLSSNTTFRDKDKRI